MMRLPPKRDVALALLDGPSVYVHLDPRREGVIVPKWLAQRPQLILQIGYNMALPIPDLEVSEVGIGCTLSFNRSPVWCFMPWSAVYGLVCEDGRAMIWPDDVPAELAAEQARARLQAVPDAAPAKKRGPGKKGAAPKPKLAVVPPSEPPADDAVSDAGAAEPGSSPGSSPAEDDSGRKRELPAYLRVVK